MEDGTTQPGVYTRRQILRRAGAAGIVVSSAPMIKAAAGLTVTQPGPLPAPQAKLAYRGVTIPVWYLDTYATDGFSDLLPQLVTDGFNYVTLNPYPYFTSASNPTVEASNTTASIASMITAIQAIQANGMQAVLKTTASFGDGTDSETYTGTGGDNGAAFLSNYTELLVSYAEMCQTNGVAHMEICYEMDSLAQANPAGFRALISTVRETFKGTISYGATSWYYGNITFWDACDFIGVHGYFDLVPAANATTSNTNVAAMVAYLSTGTQSNGTSPPVPTLAALSAKYGKQVLFSELGYLSVAGCAYQPWKSANAQPGSGNATSQADQAAAIQATLAAYTPQAWCAGLFYWMWDTIGEVGAQQVNDYTPHNKVAEAVLRSAWT